MRRLRCLNKRFNAVVLEQHRVPWRLLTPSDLRPSNNACVAEENPGCRCYRHLFESLEERLDILVRPANPRDDISASRLLEDIVIKLPYRSNATGRRWISFMGSIEKALRGGQLPLLVSLHVTLCGWDGETYLEEDVEEATALANSLLRLVWDFDLRYD